MTLEKANLAFSFFGITRALRTHTIASIEQNIFQASKRQGYAFDVFCHLYKSQTITNPRSQEYDLPNDWQSYQLLNPKATMIEEMAPIVKTLDMAHFSKNGDGWEDHFKSLQNMLLQWHSIQEVWQLMKSVESQRSTPYDVVVFLRPDMEFTTPIDLAEKDFAANVIYTLKKGRFNGSNDRFAMGAPNVLEIWANRHESADAFLETGRAMHSESLLTFHLEHHGIEQRLCDLECRRVRINGLALPH
jgi:hypothetical protein